MNKADVGLGCIVATLWGLNFIAIELGIEGVPPLMLVALRFFVVAFPAIFFLKRPPVEWKWLITLALTLNVLQFALLFAGMKLGMPAGMASLVHQSQAFFTLIFAVFIIGERFRWFHLTGLIIAAAGMAVIGSEQGGTMTAIGFWVTLAASASWGVGNVFMRRATLGVPRFSMLSLVVWSYGISLLPMVVVSLSIEGAAAWQAAFSNINLTSVGSIIYLSYFSSLGGYGLWGLLLSRYPANIVSPFALLVPIVGMTGAALLLGEMFTLLQVAGAILVMAGLALNLFGGRLTGHKQAEPQTLPIKPA